MTGRDSRGARVARGSVAWAASWLVGAAVWLVLVDTTYTPELIAGAVAAALAATGTELVRRQRIARISAHPRWLVYAWRPLLRVPADVARLTLAALAQLIHPQASRGRFVALRFEFGGEEPSDHGRRALAEGLGSFSPNTYVVGIDHDRDLILVHQMVPTREQAKAIDPLELA
jgi:multisubunit Na+/H+ antiporter MnhE subunit